MLKFAHLRIFCFLVFAACAAQLNAAESAKPDLALDGNCAVCLVKGQKLVPGKSEYTAVYDGKTYLFPSAKELEVFQSTPEQFAPVLNGDCVVCLVNANVRMPGSSQHFTFHKNRLFLFPSEEQQQMFQADPDKFSNADLALDGQCAVCLKRAGKSVPGKPEFTVRHEGWRYQFPSQKEKEVFAAAPEKFVVTATGKTACAACNFKINPLTSPGELGLALQTKGDKILVIEDAHKKYPEIYQKRFDGLNATVIGTPIATDGDITWIIPTFLSVQK